MIRRLPAEPLLRRVAARGGGAACGTKLDGAVEQALQRARREGTVTVYAADLLAVRLLNLTPWEVWGDDYAPPRPPASTRRLSGEERVLEIRRLRAAGRSLRAVAAEVGCSTATVHRLAST